MRNKFEIVVVICITIVALACLGLTAWLQHDCIEHNRDWNSVSGACE